MSNSRPVSINLYDMTNAAVSSGTVQYIFRGAIEGNFVHPAGTTSVTVTSGTATTTLLTSAIGNAFPYDLVVTDGLDYSFLLPYGDGGTVNVATLITSTNNPPAQNLYEPQLGSPGTSGHVLSSTTGGVRSWVAPSGGGAVDSVFGRTDAVVAATGDYTTDQITDASIYGGASLTDTLDTIGGEISSKQDYDADLAVIAALTTSNDDIIQRKAGAWTNRTVAQYVTDILAGWAAHVVTFLQSASAADARTAIGAGTGNGDLLAANNLSDVTASTARTNLAVPGLATANTFTAAQMVDGTADAIQLRVQGHSTQTSIFQTWEDSGANILAAVTKLDTNSGRINVYVGNAIVGSWYPSGTTVRFQTAGGYDLVFLNHGAELMRGTSLGRLGIGTTAAQGKLHVYDTGGGFLQRYASGVVGSATSIIPNGTGDVTLVLSGTFTVSDGAGNVAGGVITATAPGANFNLYDDGGTNTLQLQVAADGSVSVIRTAGARTYAVNLNLNWM